MRPPRRSTVVALDMLAAALLVLAAAIFSSGGFILYLGSIRVSLTSTHRALTAFAVLAAFRFIRAPRVGPFGRWTAAWERLLDTIEREPLLVPLAPGAWTRGVAAAAGIAAALAILLHEQLRHLYSVPDLGDPLFSIWRVAWVAHQIVTDPMHLFDANIFYPERLTLTLSDPVLLPALSVAPFLALGVHPVLVYNLLLMSGFWLSGVATYVLVERLTGSARAAFIAGLSYACAGFRFDHYSHLELQMTQWMPLALLALHLFVTTKRWRYALALALAGVAQLYSAMYYAVFFLVYAAVVGAGLLLVYRTSVRPLIRPLAACAIGAAILAWPLAHAFTAAEPMKGVREPYEVEFYSAAPVDYLRAHNRSPVWRRVLLPSAPERALFPGAAPLALAAAAMAPPLGTMRLVYGAGLLAAFDGSLGLHGVMYPYFYELLSPFRGLRVPARNVALVSMTLAILGGFGARRALRWRPSRRYQHVMFAALVALVMIDAWPTLALEPVWREPPAIYQALEATPNAVLAELPIVNDDIFNVRFMYFSAWHWTRLVNGYSGFVPASYTEFHEQMKPFPTARAIAALRSHGVTYVVLNCGVELVSPEECAATLNAMRQESALRLISTVRWNNQPVALFEMLPP